MSADSEVAELPLRRGKAADPSQREWTWRDTRRPGPLLGSFNAASKLVGLSRRPFVPEKLMEAAAGKAGLSDFGDPGFRVGLEVLCETLSADRDMTGVGHMVARRSVLDSLVNRLKIVDWWKRHPEAAEETIERPWFITGLIRSGTTLSSNLLDLDPLARSPLHWECTDPIPPAELPTRWSDPRIAATAAELARMEKQVPQSRAIHAFDADSPQECIVMMQADLNSAMFYLLTLAPQYVEWYTHSDKRSTYRLHKQILQIWQSAIPTRHWALKAPHHLHGVRSLKEVYPDARMIWTHRDPLVCIASVCSLQMSVLKVVLPNADPHIAGRQINQHWLAGIRNMMAFDRSQPEGDWCHHVYYNDVVKDPAATIRSAYTHFNDEIDPVHERLIEAWVRARPKNKFGIHRYSLNDFGLDANELRQQYAEYTETYEVPHEYA